MPTTTIGQGLKALKIVSVILPLIAGTVWGGILFQSARQTAETHVQTQARLLAQHIERVIEAQQVLHRAVISRLAEGDADFIESAELHRFLQVVAKAQPSMKALQIVNPDGLVLADSDRFPAGFSAHPADYSAPIAAGETIWVSRIVAEQQDVIVIASPITLPVFTGYVLSEIKTASVQTFLRSVAIRPGEAASIARRDGMLLLRNFDADPMMLPADAPGRIIPAVAEQGHFQAKAVSDGVTRIYGFDWAENLPIVANFGEPVSLVWRDWARQFGPLMAMFLLMGMVLWITTERMQRGLAHRAVQIEIRKRAETAERLAEQRIHLMREMNHRVKNNLALVVSLINMQSRNDNGVDADLLKSRIGAISHVHDLMHQAADAVHVDFASMLQDIADSPAVVPRESGITVETALEKGILLGPDRITPLTVVAAELMTNAVKHAFRGRSGGTIRLQLFRDLGSVVLIVSDDGVGMSDTGDRHSGNAIIEALVQQIDGHLQRKTGAGLTTILRFPE